MHSVTRNSPPRLMKASPRANVRGATAAERRLPAGESSGEIQAAPLKEMIHTRIARDLAVDIISGLHPAGTVLVNEVGASAELGISRTAYREAIRILAAKGLVASRPKSGTTVCPKAEWNVLDPDVLDWTFEAGPTEEFILALFELRRMVEPAAAALAAERRTPEQLAQMGHAIDEITRFGFERREGQLADRRFHSCLLAATGNPAVIALTRTISTAVEATTLFKQRKRRLARDATPEHYALFAAIADRDPERARAANIKLIDLAMEDLKRGMQD